MTAPDGTTEPSATTTLVIDGRFNGPPGSANGGYSAGLLAARLDGPAVVTLLAPVPLDRALEVVAGPERVRLLDGGLPIAEATPTTVEDVAPPARVSFEEAEQASRSYVGFEHHEFATCFVCGPRRPERDGLGIFAGPVDGTPVVAAPWTPSPEFADDGRVRTPVVWGVLDCPSFFGGGGDERALLGRIAADVRTPLRAGEPYVVVAWGLGGEGRKHFAASAILDAAGQVQALSRSVWIVPRRD